MVPAVISIQLSGHLFIRICCQFSCPVSLYIINRTGNIKMKKPFTKFAEDVINVAISSAEELDSSYVGTEHLLIGLAESEGSISQKILNKQGVTSESVRDLLRKAFKPASYTAIKDGDGFSPKARELQENAEAEAVTYKSAAIGTEHLLIALVKQDDSAALRILSGLGANKQKIFTELLSTLGEDIRAHKGEIAVEKDGKNSSSAKQRKQESMLEQFSRDLCAQAREGRMDPVIGREDEVSRVVQILSRRTKNNPCLVGEPGVGKTAIAEALAQRIVEGSIAGPIADKRVLSLDLPAMVAGTKYRGEFEERVKKLVREVSEDGKVILFMDEIHTMIGAGGAEGAIDAANILKPALARGEIQIIGATTQDEYRKHFEKDAALERRFQPVYVEQPTKEETVEILKGLRHGYEEHHKVNITDEAINSAVELSVRYINDRYLPDKAIDLIDEASSRVRLDSYILSPKARNRAAKVKNLEAELEDLLKKGDYITAHDVETDLEIARSRLDEEKRRSAENKEERPQVTGEDVADVVAKWTRIPVKKLAEEESTKLQNLEETLHKRVIAQDDAVKAVSKAIRRGRAGLKDPNKPIGSFLFLGPTGVGKTELSKALAETLFGTEDSIIRFDMSEFMESYSVSKLIGSPPGYVGYDEGGQLSEQVRRHPYSIILFDEIEKAHPEVFNILLQVLDDGRITDSHGRVADFKNTIIIMTSNAGARDIMEPKTLGFSTDKSEKHDHEVMKQSVMAEVERIFRPEFINRIDEIIVFSSLTKENMKGIVDIVFGQIARRAKSQLDIKLTITDKAKEILVDEGYDRRFGARSLKRKVQSLVEDELSEQIISGSIQRGDRVSVVSSGGKISFRVKRAKVAS